MKVLSAEGVKTNVTLIFTANQALLAARAGATYVSPFLGRLDDISVRGVGLINEIAQIFEVAGIETEIIAASIRNPMHITDCALAGADIATVPYKGDRADDTPPADRCGHQKFRKTISQYLESKKEKSMDKLKLMKTANEVRKAS